MEWLQCRSQSERYFKLPSSAKLQVARSRFSDGSVKAPSWQLRINSLPSPPHFFSHLVKMIETSQDCTSTMSFILPPAFGSPDCLPSEQNQQQQQEEEEAEESGIKTEQSSQHQVDNVLVLSAVPEECASDWLSANGSSVDVVVYLRASTEQSQPQLNASSIRAFQILTKSDLQVLNQPRSSKEDTESLRVSAFVQRRHLPADSQTILSQGNLRAPTAAIPPPRYLHSSQRLQ